MKIKHPKNPKRFMLILSAIVLLHLVVIYGLSSIQPKVDNSPKLVYTSIYTDPNLTPTTFYIALPEAPCVKLQENAPAVTDELPKCLELRKAPELAAQLNQEAYVQMDFTVDNTGKVIDPKVTKSCGNIEVDKAAQKHISETWQFAPCPPDDADGCKRSIKFRWGL
ncbi:MAG TPA: energy transducer TonB [Cellvibrionaceae bacterium]|nr:energy transducer TonB [Cellvibrionaceae bacterium]HMW46874.1 energy transducer TonB [Cellvibrionaceae bacterium]HMY38547.1 energy transducer TonB [Marinagarivorans sp.]HNG58471.1 energy transducer TonB [Cellvibrionaceae bacterium]